MSNKLVDAINKQINEEFFSAYTYLSMSVHFGDKNLGGFAQWMHAQYEEEMGHGMRLLKHVQDRGGKVVLQAIEKPDSDFGGPLEVFQQSLGHEKKVTRMIIDLYELALQEKDYASQVELQWFVNEQVEEESSVSDICERLKMAGDHPGALMMVEREVNAGRAH
ncbi:MAG: ferritin [Planctomycetota bacterium]|jgi:ferritin